MTGLAIALLIYLLVNKLWSTLDPDSLGYNLNSAFRGVVILAGQVAMIVLLAMIVGLTGWLLAGYIAAFLVLDWGASKAQGDL